MCDKCHKQVINDIGVLDSDLQYLPYKLVKWQCIVPGCNNCKKVRDYGILPFYWDAVKIKRRPNGRWRGGWFDASCHFYMCSKHWKPLMNRLMPRPEITSEIMISKIIIL